MQCLKYLVLANMLMESRVDPFDSQEARPYKADPEVGCRGVCGGGGGGGGVVCGGGADLSAAGRRHTADAAAPAFTPVCCVRHHCLHSQPAFTPAPAAAACRSARW